MTTTKTAKGKLPPQRKFALSYILSHSPKATNNLQQLNDDIINTVHLYNDDINEQMNAVAQVEDELIGKLERVQQVYDVVHNIRIEDIDNNQIELPNSVNGEQSDENATTPKQKKTRSKSRGSTLGMGISMFRLGNNKPQMNKFEQYEKINDDIEQIVESTVSSKKRLDCMIEKLKKLESKLTRRERLFDDQSANQYHYKNLYKYGMKDEIAKEQERMDAIDAYVEENMSRIEGNDLDVMSNRKSESSHRSKISPVKLKQYLDIENELEELQKKKNEKVNPPPAITIEPHTGKTDNTFDNRSIITLASNKFGPGLKFQSDKRQLTSCMINYEPITVQANVDKLVNDINIHNDDVTPLIDELKKMYQ